MSSNRSSDNRLRVSRREAMSRGVCGAAGLLLADHLGPAALGATTQPVKAAVKAKAKSVIQIFLWGGMSHNDTWDPKPESGREYMGEFGQGDLHQRGRHPTRRSCSLNWRSRPTSSR